MLDYDLSIMKGADGSALWYEVNTCASEHAVRIYHTFKSTPCYSQLTQKLRSPRLPAYFKFIIKREIYPFIHQACVIQWYKRNNQQISHKENTVLVPNYGVLSELARCWNFESVPIKLIGLFSLSSIRDISCRTFLLRRVVRAYIKNCIGEIFKRISIFKKRNTSPQTSKKQTIACHFVEGADFSKRNCLNWYPESGIDSERVLIYFDTLFRGERVKKEVIQHIERLGFRWIALKKSIIENQSAYFWRAPKIPDDFCIKKNSAHSIKEKWLLKAGNDLLRQVHFWSSFYDVFDICINYIPEEGVAKNIAQAIAFDIRKEKPGVLIGKQRSEIFIQNYNFEVLAFHPKHIFFIWNKRVKDYLSSGYGYTDMLITTGYPNNIFRNDKSRVNLLKSRGVKFIIALFDDAHGKDSIFSTKKMAIFYESFLQWLVNDPELGLIIKSKKPAVINTVPLIESLLKIALKTGRCIRIDDEWGRLPSEASFGADMAVGVGISSALIEAVIAGCKGIHYDMTGLKSHEFYRWGYESIIFDDPERMMLALKRYHSNPEDESQLGDWSSYLDLLDPFRDGKGGQRMGAYMHCLLDNFAAGKNRDEAIRGANEEYAKSWGDDKIINMRRAYETV